MDGKIQYLGDDEIKRYGFRQTHINVIDELKKGDIVVDESIAADTFKMSRIGLLSYFWDLEKMGIAYTYSKMEKSRGRPNVFWKINAERYNLFKEYIKARGSSRCIHVTNRRKPTEKTRVNRGYLVFQTA